MSADRFRSFARPASAVVLVAVSLSLAESCSFPDHTFVDDDIFYGRGKGASNGTGGSGNGNPDASLTGGSTGSGGAAGFGDHPGVGADGGIVIIGDGSRGRGDGGTAGSAGDSGVHDAGSDAHDAGPICDPGLSVCNGQCTDLLADNAHCGTCTNACTGPNVCTAGTCAPPCAMGLTACTPSGSTVMTCVDTTLDENNCGGCNKPCPTGTVCDGSKCLIDCGTLKRCGTQCFDTTKDDQHCGDCNTNCAAMGQVCSGSVCKTSCTTPYTACGNTCVNTASDDLNCGGCNKPCAAKQACVGSVCKALVENCLNGTDDDKDGLVDCADPDCTTGYTCGSLPAGWQGPFALWSGTPSTTPSCPTTYPAGLFLAHDKLSAPAYSCPNCACTPSADATCNPLHFWYDTSSTCTAPAAWDISVAPDGNCVSEDLFLYSKNFNPTSLSINSAQLTPPDRHSPALPPYASGSCTPNQPTPNFPSATWGVDVEGCGLAQGATTGGGCNVGVCMPKPAAPFGAKLCIFKAGSATCPSSYPTTNPSYYQSWTEGRKCTTCSCGQVSCGGTVKGFTDLNCMQNPTVIATDGSCTTLAPDPSPTPATPPMNNKQDTLSIRWDNGGPVCGQGSSSLVGAPTPDSPITVCCQ